MRSFLLVIYLIISNILAESPSTINEVKLKTIEDFLSSMSTLEADMTMEIDSGNKDMPVECHEGKIWLDRENGLLRINYGKNSMIARNGSLVVRQENASPQEFATDDTPAGILLRQKIDFKNEGVAVKSLIQTQDLWQLSLSYDSPAGSIPVTLYFKPKPVMLLVGWTIKNPDGSTTNVHLNLEEMHMAIKINSSVFKLD